jgi:uncharacterized protein YndB with AHSA1/START domain
MTKAIHHTLDVDASPERVYSALSDSEQFSKMTGGAAAVIGTDEGAPFSCFDGMIGGRQIELVPNERIVQAWRVANWAPGLYSIVKFELKAQGTGTRIEFDHLGFPPENREHLESGWHANYWEPLKQFLGNQ